MRSLIEDVSRPTYAPPAWVANLVWNNTVRSTTSPLTATNRKRSFMMRPIGSISWNWLLTNPSLATGDSLPITSWPSLSLNLEMPEPNLSRGMWRPNGSEIQCVNLDFSRYLLRRVPLFPYSPGIELYASTQQAARMFHLHQTNRICALVCPRLPFPRTSLPA